MPKFKQGDRVRVIEKYPVTKGGVGIVIKLIHDEVVSLGFKPMYKISADEPIGIKDVPELYPWVSEDWLEHETQASPNSDVDGTSAAVSPAG